VRRLATLGVLVAAGAVALAGSGAGGDGGGTYRVDAIFDNAANLIPGQDVKVAGAKVGSVVGLRVTRERKARVQMEVDTRFAPFRSDADCTIQPQSLIGEKFVQCAPGTPAGRRLEAQGGEAPTVPLSRTHSPVDLDLVFGALRLPVRQRLALLVNELGTGLAGRGDDLNAAIRRANPALAEANRVLAILDRDRARLGRLVEDSDAVIAQLAARRDRVPAFVRRAAAVASETAARRGRLAEAVGRLPAALAEAQPTLRRLRELSDAGTPVAIDLRTAAPQVTRLVRDLAPLARAARPALDRVGAAAQTGTSAVRAGRRVVARLRTFAVAARPAGAMVSQLFASLRDRGVVEGLQTFVYYAAAATSRFDSVSHLLPAHALGSQCQQYATTPDPLCSAKFNATQAAASARARRPGRRAAGRVPLAPGSPAPAAATPAAPAPAAPSRPGAGPLPQLPGLPPAPQVPQAIQDLLQYLLR
jgi:virulence factor Mce-like protein